MPSHAQAAAAPNRAVFERGFVVLAACWAVAQAHHGSMMGAWTDEASLPGNACWLLILYCQLRLGLDWLTASWRDRRLHPLLLLSALCVATLEIACLASGEPLARPGFGMLLFFAQPLIVLFGFAALHRRQAVQA